MKKKKAIIITLSVVLLLSLTYLGSCIGALALSIRTVTKVLSPKVDKLFEYFSEDRYIDAYDELIAYELKREMPFDEFEATFSEIQPVLGDLQSKKMDKWYMRQGGRGRFVDLYFNATFENGPG